MFIYIQSNLHLRPPLYNGHFFCPDRQSIHLLLFKALHNGHLSTTATATKAWPNCQKNTSVTDEKVKMRMVMKIDSYGMLMINRGIGILIVLHLYCCSKYKLSTILIANVVNLARFVSFKFDSKHCSSFWCILSLYLLYMIKLLLLDTVSMIIIHSKYFFVPNWLKSQA